MTSKDKRRSRSGASEAAARGSVLGSLVRFLPEDVRTALAAQHRRPIPVQSVLPGVVPAAGAPPARVVVELEPAVPRPSRLDTSIRHATDGLALGSRPLFPGADQAPDPYGLANFIVIELDWPRAAIGPHGHDLAYRLMGMDEVRRAHYEGAYLSYAPLGSVLGGGVPPQDKNWALKAVKRMRPPSGTLRASGRERVADRLTDDGPARSTVEPRCGDHPGDLGSCRSNQTRAGKCSPV